MKRFLSICFLLAGLHNTAIAQEKGNLYLQFGTTIPIDPFSNADVSNDKAGAATPGFHFNLGYRHPFSKYFGGELMAQVSYQGVQAEAMARAIYFTLSNSGTTVKVGTGSWTMTNSFIGIFGQYPVKPKLELGGRILYGFSTVESPTLTIDLLNSPTAVSRLEQNAGSANTFSIMLGVNARYTLSNRLKLLLNIDYWALKPAFRKVELRTNVGNTSYLNFDQDIRNINLSLGLGYSLFFRGKSK